MRETTILEQQQHLRRSLDAFSFFFMNTYLRDHIALKNGMMTRRTLSLASTPNAQTYHRPRGGDSDGPARDLHKRSVRGRAPLGLSAPPRRPQPRHVLRSLERRPAPDRARRRRSQGRGKPCLLAPACAEAARSHLAALDHPALRRAQRRARGLQAHRRLAAGVRRGRGLRAGEQVRDAIFSDNRSRYTNVSVISC